MYRRTMTQKIQEAVFQMEMPAKEIAARIGKPYPTLMRELNPWDRSAKLGIEDAVAIIRVTGDRRILDIILEEAGLK